MPLTATVARGAAALGWKASEPARSASARIDLAIVDLDEDGSGAARRMPESTCEDTSIVFCSLFSLQISIFDIAVMEHL
jgi:hypothetical protein